MKRTLLLMLACCFPFASARAQSAALSDSTVVGLLERELPLLMQRLEVPGAVVTVVRGSRVLLNRGYGLADKENRIPVSADSTVFRIASVAKIFAALAVLQLQEAGRLRLDQDVRALVPEIALGEEPVTLLQLLTHTAGFDDLALGYLSQQITDSLDLTRVLVRGMPARGRPPGDLPAYSNHGYALAGLVVERISGLPFDRYVQSHILTPLGMTSSAFLIPPLPALDRLRATEYRSTGERRDFSFSPTYPAGNVGTTGSDMSRLLSALLTGDSTPITAHTRAQLMGPALTYHPELPPMGLGFSAQRLGGHVMWIKGGASRSHSAVLALFPDLDLGIFVAVNRQEPLVWTHLLQTLGDSLRAAPMGSAPSAGTLPHGRSADGAYRWTRVPLRSAEKLFGLAAQVRVQQLGDTLRLRGPELNGTWLRRGEQLYVQPDGRELGLRVSSNGDITHLASMVQGQPVVFERIPFHQTARFQLSAVLLGAAFSMSAAVAAQRMRGKYTRSLDSWEKTALIALPVAELATLATAVFLARGADQLALGPTPSLYSAAALTTATAALAVAQFVAGARLSADARLGMGYRLTYGLGALGGAALFGVLASNNLIGFQF